MDKGALAESCSKATSRPFNIAGLPAISASEEVHIREITHRITDLRKAFDEPTVLQAGYG
mgnify:CR=1 FL=1